MCLFKHINAFNDIPALALEKRSIYMANPVVALTVGDKFSEQNLIDLVIALHDLKLTPQRWYGDIITTSQGVITIAKMFVGQRSCYLNPIYVEGGVKHEIIFAAGFLASMESTPAQIMQIIGLDTFFILSNPQNIPMAYELSLTKVHLDYIHGEKLTNLNAALTSVMGQGQSGNVKQDGSYATGLKVVVKRTGKKVNVYLSTLDATHIRLVAYPFPSPVPGFVICSEPPHITQRDTKKRARASVADAGAGVVDAAAGGAAPGPADAGAGPADAGADAGPADAGASGAAPGGVLGSGMQNDPIVLDDN